MDGDKQQSSLEVYTALDGLEKQLAELREAMGSLHGRLEPVLSPDAAKAHGDQVKQIVNRAPLAELINTRSTQVVEIRDMVTETLDRLQI